MKKLTYILYTLLISNLANANVDIRQGSFHDSNLDFIIVNSSSDMRLQRQYSSRSISKGWFGWGWCSNYEDKVEVKKGNNQIIYISCNLKVILNKDNNEPSLWKSNSADNYFAFKKSSNYHLSKKDGFELIFNKNGELIERLDKRGRSLKITRHKRFLQDENIILVKDSTDIQMKLVFGKGGTVNRVLLTSAKNLVLFRGKDFIRPKSVRLNYLYSDGNLKTVSSTNTIIYRYSYSKTRNLELIVREDKKAKKVAYDEQQDSVVQVNNFDGCIETLTYWLNPQKPKAHYRTRYVKSCNSMVVQAGTFEFNYAKHPVVGRYLKVMKTYKGKTVKQVRFNPYTGQPVQRNISNHN